MHELREGWSMRGKGRGISCRPNCSDPVVIVCYWLGGSPVGNVTVLHSTSPPVARRLHDEPKMKTVRGGSGWR